MKQFLILTFCWMALAASAQVAHVNPSATGANNGSSWQDAYTNLQTALASTNSGDIWVAEGTYKPTEGTDREASFELKSGVALYGGFPAEGNPGWAGRDWEAHPTILSGDIGVENDTSDNSYSVVYFSSSSNFEAILDGLVIEGGNASYSGGGLSGDGGWNLAQRNLLVSNCLFRNNFSGYEGGAVSLWMVNATFEDCIFEGNYADYSGAALEVSGGFKEYQYTAKVTDCIFQNNYSGYEGAAISTSWISTHIDRCIFEGNYAETEGGAINLFSNWFQNDEVRLICSNSIFRNNTSGSGGGAVATVGHNYWYNCIFQGNYAAYQGGALSHFGHGVVAAVNCNFVGNLTDGGGSALEIFSWSQDTVVVQADFANCVFAESQSSLFENGLSSDRFNLHHCLLDLAACPPGVTCGDGMLMGEDPAFVDFDDFHLTDNSPCIEAGDNASLPADLLTDFDGNARILGGAVDLGAYEFGGALATEEARGKAPPVFPNPVQNVLHLQWKVEQPSDLMVRVLDLTGRTVSSRFYEAEGPSGEIELDVSMLPPAAYLLHVQTNQVQASQFFIKEN